MTCFKCQCGIAVRLMLVLLAAFSLNSLAEGQGTISLKDRMLRGESVSPQLSGKILQLLFDGVSDLYSYADGTTNYYFITDINGRLFTLSVPRKESKDEALSVRQGIISVLKVLMQDAPALHARIEACELDKHELTGLMHDYHIAVSGSDEGIEYELPPPALVPHIGFIVGNNVDLLKAGSTGSLNGFRLDPALYPFAGISIRAFLPRISNNLSINLDLYVGKRYIYGYYSTAAVAPPFTEIYKELHMYNYLMLADFMVGHSFGQGHIKPYASCGICTRTIFADNSRVETDICSDSEVISDTFEYSPEDKTNLGFKVSFSLSYEISRLVILTAGINYSELLFSPAYGSYKSAGVTIGANF